MTLDRRYFEELYATSPDPWDFATSGYEAAKYTRTVAALEGRRYGRVLELGCSIGVLTALLAPWCDELVAIEPVAAARRQARERTAGLPHVEVRDGAAPDALPPGPWDLVVASEVLYYLDVPALTVTLGHLEDGLRPGGHLLAVHWTPPTTTYPQQGDAVHEQLLSRPGLQPVHADRDDTWRLDLFRRR